MWGKGVSVMSVSATGSYGSDGSSSLAAAGVLMSSPEAAGVPSPPLVSSPEAVAQHNCASEQEHQAERSGSVQSPAQSQYSDDDGSSPSGVPGQRTFELVSSS